MNFDALTVGAVCHELRTTVVGGRVQHVHHPEELALAFEIYAQGGAGPHGGSGGSGGAARTRPSKARWLYLSAHPEQARVHLAAERPARTTDHVTPLLLMLRKYVDGGRLDAVEQPPLERVIHLRFSRRAPTGELWQTELVAEIMGRLSNLILVDTDGSVMDAVKRVPASINRVRTVLPRHRYDPPPPQDKLNPLTLSPLALQRAIEAAPPAKSAADALVAQVNGCSPLLAREVVFRAHDRAGVAPGEADWGAIASALQEIWRDAAADRWGPSVAPGADGRLAAYAAYPLRSFPDVEPAPSISAALERWFRERASGPKPAVDAARRLSFRKALLESQDALRGKLFSLRRSLADEAEVDALRQRGEQLFAEGQPEEAQRVFAQYTKAKAALREVPAMIKGVEHELRYLDEALTLLDLASTPGELNELRAEWSELGYLSGAAAAKPAKPPKNPGKFAKGRGGRSSAVDRRSSSSTGFRRVNVEGFDVLVGKSGRGNDVLLAREARPNDVWLHARGVPGAHVIVRSGGRDVPELVLRRAAAYAAGHSQARTAPTVGVDYTLCKHVHRIKGAPPGLANYQGERTIHVAPATVEPTS